eukprot:NODE_3234_length_1391_cov_92.196372_g2810_i0.p2 GENE.NODE_3234_length_1391_cov_92.196372_g2810_i0~~NODE_3234_length_1391_cov_92.196372_g2810_i0.p2  ORF type:complete len:145 (-),score=21.30 NODE_3234_length_1391_cov_92.196372_g2810_i0:344-778(-)
MVMNTGETEYFKLLASGDVGLSLMVSPHPSLPPFDFAAAGMVTVTNSFETKTAADFVDVSENIIVVDPYIESLVEGLRQAVGRIDNVESRRRGAKLSWATKWNDERCYGPNLFKKIRTWMDLRQPVDEMRCYEPANITVNVRKN